MNSTEKVCKSCRVSKLLSDFHKDKYVKGGYKHKCKLCVKNKIKVLTDSQIGYKECTICAIEKPLIEFTKSKRNKSGIMGVCTVCFSSTEKEKNKATYEKNREIIRERQREYYLRNREKILKAVKKYASENKDKVRERRKEYDKKNRDKIAEYRRNKKQKDNLEKLRRGLYSNLRSHFTRHVGGKKKRRTIEILGCTFEEFKHHIESQFLPWMSWSNYGNTCKGEPEYNCSWDLDHIIPLIYAKNEEEVYLLNHWSNFQPLCSKINRYVKKGTIPLVTNVILKLTTIKDEVKKHKPTN